MSTDPEADRPAASAAQERVLDETGHVHLTDAPIDLSIYPFEAWIALVFFWLCAICVFYQFFTRYFLNDSASWTEEISRYLLIATVFIGLAAAVRLNRHIHVDFLYRVISRPVGHVLARVVDVAQIAFFAAATVLTALLMEKMQNYNMTIIDLPMNSVYGVCLVGFAAATLRAVQVAWIHWRRGFSPLERPDIASTPDASV